MTRLEERAPGERARLVRVLLRDARVERRAPRIDMRARLVAHVRAAARAAERAEAVRAIREPRNLRQRRIDEVVAAHVDDVALRRACLDRRLRVGVDCDTQRARSRRAAGAVRIAGAACAVRIFRAAGVARFARTARASRATGTTRAARAAGAARATRAACRYGFRCEDEVLVIFVRHGARELCRDADEDIDFLVDCRVREQIAAALFLDEIDFFGFLEIRAAIRMDVDRATPHVGIFVRREMEQDVVCLRLGGEIEMVRVEVRDIASRGRACDIQRVAAHAARRTGDITAINRPSDRAASEIDNVVRGCLFAVAAIDIARDRAAIDGNGIAIRLPVRRHAAGDEAVYGRARANRDVVLRDITCIAVRADGAARHRAIDRQCVAGQLRRIRLAIRQSGDGALVGVFTRADRDRVPRILRVIFHDNDILVGIIRRREGFRVCDCEDEFVVNSCHRTRDVAEDNGQCDVLLAVSGQRAAGFLDQIDHTALGEILQRVAGSHFHVVLADFRFSRARKGKELCPTCHGRRERERIVHIVDIQNEVVAACLHFAMRRDRGGSGVGAVFVGVVQLFCAARIVIRKRARRRVVLQQIDGIAFVERKELAGKAALVERHVGGVNLRFSRIRGREERVFVRRRGARTKLYFTPSIFRTRSLPSAATSPVVVMVAVLSSFV